MENPQSQEHNLPPEDLPEAESANTVEALLAELGFAETTDLSLAKVRLQEAFAANDEAGIKEAIALYNQLGIEAVERKQGDEYARAQIGLIVAMGLLRLSIDRQDYFARDIEEATTYAENMGYEDLVSIIEDIEKQASGENQEALTPSQEIAAILADIGEEYGFDEETCAEIAAQPFEEAFENAYNYLMQAGLDADEVLAAFTESSDQPTNE